MARPTRYCVHRLTRHHRCALHARRPGSSSRARRRLRRARAGVDLNSEEVNAMTDTRDATDLSSLIGRDDINDLEAILAVSNTDVNAKDHKVGANVDSIFTWDYERSRP